MHGSTHWHHHLLVTRYLLSKKIGLLRRWSTNVHTHNLFRNLTLSLVLVMCCHVIPFADKPGTCWSLVGMHRRQSEKPTMMLNYLGDIYPKSYVKHQVINQFGHALGLENEHQRSDFWDVVREFIDIDKMKLDPRFSGLKTKEVKEKYFRSDYLEKKIPKGSVVYKSEYDSQSIMHYWWECAWTSSNLIILSAYRFDVAWIRNVKYHHRKGIASDSSLTWKQKQCLQGIHNRHNSYAFNPSPSDFRTLEEAYGEWFHFTIDEKISFHNHFLIPGLKRVISFVVCKYSQIKPPFTRPHISQPLVTYNGNQCLWCPKII